MADIQHRRWVIIALLPGLVSDVLFAALVVLSMRDTNSDSVATVGTGMLYVALFLPLTVPAYVYLIGRKHVQAVYGGFKSTFSFALLYGAANLLLWACGAALAGATMKWPGGT
jgi:hypothetical protein